MQSALERCCCQVSILSPSWELFLPCPLESCSAGHWRHSESGCHGERRGRGAWTVNGRTLWQCEWSWVPGVHPSWVQTMGYTLRTNPPRCYPEGCGFPNSAGCSDCSTARVPGEATSQPGPEDKQGPSGTRMNQGEVSLEMVGKAWRGWGDGG